MWLRVCVCERERESEDKKKVCVWSEELGVERDGCV